ncbi:hypothetical protein H0G86_010908 [Trichoderma simmonsii]|uniref:Uncharacterized protein n=1 Tax=Trichoderma simmonsii TaxID=1491479 RepID=A0A8G0LPS6_9HYPO|nr:hypothetical protein H0G86_010908 [Trichoderma simmonsii]
MEETNHIHESILFASTNDQHVPDCSPDCQSQLLSSLASNPEEGVMCQTFSHFLEDGRGRLPLFYHCGSHLCKMKSIGDADQDLSVRRFLSSCPRKDYGLGSSGQTHARSGSIVGGKEHARRQQQQPTTSSTLEVPTATPSGFLVEGFHTVTTKINPPPASEIAPGVAASGSPVIHLITTTETSKPLRHRTGGKSPVPVSTKVTIGVSVMVGILAVLALIAWHLRLKARLRNKKRISRPIKPSSLPPTPLISPSSSYAGPPSGPLTPPPRLQERRFLLTRALSLRRNNQRRQYNDEDSQEWAGVPLSPMPPLSPLSPLSIPRTRWNSEEHEHSGITATTTISQITHVNRPPRDDLAPAASVSSIFSSASTLRAASNTSADSTQIRYSGATATDLPRPPPRVYETPPMIRGLASPGPPPTRALPSLPANGRVSPFKSPLTSPASPSRRGSPSFAASARPSVGTSERNNGSQRSGEESGQGGAGRSVDVPVQSPRRARHVRSPLGLNSMMKKE